MNDLFEFDINKLNWNELKAKGDIPKARSACKLMYWNNNLILIGGG
jgi:hypothetical protein